MINSDEIHFVAAKNKSQFIIKTHIGPFIFNSRAAGEEADILLRQMKFPLSFTWSYDPFGIISQLRTKHNTTPYVHTQTPEIERYMNQVEWEENTLQELEEKHVSMTTSQTIMLMFKILLEFFAFQ
jgi:hypothetical protein